MSQFLLNFIINNIFIIIAFCVIFLVIAIISKPFRKIILFGFTLGCIYLGLVALYKLGIGNNTLYQWSLKVIYSGCILFERIFNFVFISESLFSKFIALLMKYGYDGFTIFKEYSEYACTYVLPYLRSKNDLNYSDNNILADDMEFYFNIDKKIKINNIRLLSMVFRC